MKKNIIIIMLAMALGLVLIWPDSPKPSDKPTVNILLPDQYCGEFVVFWGENTPPVDEPPNFLNYNYYPEHPNAVILNLPEPYKGARLHFMYEGQEGPVGRNPIVKLFGLTGVKYEGGYEVLENGHTRSLPGIDPGIGASMFVVGLECIEARMAGDTTYNQLYSQGVSSLYLSIVEEMDEGS